MVARLDDPAAYCAILEEWSKLMAAAHSVIFDQAWNTVHLAITKSCLLDRMMYSDEKPSQTPCPVHKGKWSGIHWHWPGAVGYHIGEQKEVPLGVVDPMLATWFKDGCRCFLHKCACTTGWQIDRHCGCLDENGCYTMPEGSCVSPVDCIHSARKET